MENKHLNESENFVRLRQLYQSSLPYLNAETEQVSFHGFHPQASAWPLFNSDRRPLQAYNEISKKSCFERPRRRLRTIFSNHQILILENAYLKNKYPDACVKKDISREANLPVERVQVWFQNKRTRDKRLKEEKKENKWQCDVVGFETRSKVSNVSAVNSPQKLPFKPLTMVSGTTTEDKVASENYAVKARCKDIDKDGNKAYLQLAKSTPKQESPSNGIEKSCQQYLQLLDPSSASGISPSFVRYLHQQLRMSPADETGPLTLKLQQCNSKLSCDLFQYR